MEDIRQEGNALIWEQNNETVRIEPWGQDSIRVRATIGAGIRDDLPGALLEPLPTEAHIEMDTERVVLRVGALAAEIRQQEDPVRTLRPAIRFLKATTGDELLAEADD